MRFELAKPKDAERIAALSRDHIEAGLPLWQWHPRRVRAAIVERETCTVLALENAVLAGFAMMHFGDHDAHLNLLAVDPNWRRQGIGRGLLKWLEDSCRVAGIPEIHLEVRADNTPALRFYNALGFTPARTIPAYYCGRIAAVRMWRNLSATGVLPKYPAV